MHDGIGRQGAGLGLLTLVGLKLGCVRQKAHWGNVLRLDLAMMTFLLNYDAKICLKLTIQIPDWPHQVCIKPILAIGLSIACIERIERLILDLFLTITRLVTDDWMDEWSRMQKIMNSCLVERLEPVRMIIKQSMLPTTIGYALSERFWMNWSKRKRVIYLYVNRYGITLRLSL